MRLFFDAHLSPKKLGGPLRAKGHDVFAIAEHPELDGLSDPQLLEFAAEERRILVTCDARDFAPLLRVWAEDGVSHSGCILIWSVEHHHFREVLLGIERCLNLHPRARDWVDLTMAI